ncbi:gasdermin-A3-like [Sylvia borin]
MFKKATKSITNQMDPYKEFVPVKSIISNEHFRPLCLLEKKRKPKTRSHRASDYHWTGFTLQDVLLPGEDDEHIEPILEVSSQFTLTNVRAGQADGGVSVSAAPAKAEVQGGAFIYEGYCIKVQKKGLSQKSLEALKGQRKINMDHSFIRQLQTTDTALYMVTESLEAAEEVEYKNSAMADGHVRTKLHGMFSAKGSGEYTQSIVIPKGCTLAFRIIQIHIRDGTWDLGYFSRR